LEDVEGQLGREHQTVVHLAEVTEKFRRLSALILNGGDRPIRRILIVKTTSAHYCRATLDQVGSFYPEARLTLWTEERESDEFYLRPDIERIVLYRNLSAIPRMVLELRETRADLVVIQSTAETDYFKMNVLDPPPPSFTVVSILTLPFPI